ncbi:hypothetical protein E2562_004427 [Oryza meyeriana var. granulata]|uniref:Uncharacterized protein n=1 Tax=Oryza meyeriana var. granulata TaxID=110450 RepID=A0A6G1CZA8_9ORYZ|nr:hypothetical protein E2562_004427 [Oryza meyeriana var. granulata]
MVSKNMIDNRFNEIVDYVVQSLLYHWDKEYIMFLYYQEKRSVATWHKEEGTKRRDDLGMIPKFKYF